MSKKSPNHLFLQYLKEFKEESAERGDKSSRTYFRAACCMKKYPLPLQSGAEASIIQNIGPKICQMLDKRLARDAANEGISPREFLEKSRSVPGGWWEYLEKEYSKKDDKKTTTKTKASKVAKPKAAESKRAPIKKTVKRKSDQAASNLLLKKGRKSDPYNLSSSEDDEVVPSKTQTKSNKKSNFKRPETPVETNNIDVDFNIPSDTEVTPECDKLFTLKPGSFKVVLMVDTRETAGKKKKAQLKKELKSCSCEWEEYNLQLGDFCWVARETGCYGENPRELILDYIVERKCISDLAISIVDGRYHEQKNRLRSCGLKNVVYLLEDLKQIEHQSIPPKSLRQAIYNTQIVENFQIKQTATIKETCRYLECITEHLKEFYEHKTLHAVPQIENIHANQTSPDCNLLEFKTFNENCRKNAGQTMRRMFMKQLMQISSLSSDKAESITEVYPTPLSLHQAYESCDGKDGEVLLANLKFGVMNRKIGKALSKTVHMMFNT